MTGRSLRVSRTHFPVTALGPGVRLGVWVQGCPLACKGCMSMDTWDSRGGVEVSVDALAQRWRDAIGRGATGLTVSGGEPLEQPEALRAFLTEAREISAESGGGHDILLYTGFDLTELDDVRRAAADCADVLVTGRFDVTAPTRLLWRGSANQRMIVRTGLGRARYAEHLTAEPDTPPLQVRVDETGVWLIGVPRRGVLNRLDHELQNKGLAVAQVSWRRQRRDGAAGA